MTYRDAYRDAEATTPERRPLSTVTLVGSPRTIQRIAAVLRLLFAVTLVAALFQPYHEVRRSSGWGDAFCWGPDCHPGAPPSPPSPPTYGPPTTCSGWAHANAGTTVAAIVLLLSAVVRLRRLRVGHALALTVLDLATLVGLFYSIFDLAHMFDHVRPLVGEKLFGTSFVSMAFLVLFDLVSTPLLYLWARARLPPR